jgi:very-short-patch-repair endonuclease
MSLTIKSTITAKIGFASHQNSVPVVRELEVINQGETGLENLVLELSSDPPFLETKSWRIDALRDGSTLHITDRDVKLHAGYLADLTESVSGEVRLRLLKDDEVLASSSHPVEILARNQWGGCGSMPELLPAFCMPNDPAIDRILKSASDVLRRAGKPAGIDGYNDKSRSRTWEMTSAIWSAVAGMELSYALHPSSFEETGQKVRMPGAIFEGRLANCLETTLLFAAALEQAKLNPLILLTKGHAFVGVWLQPQEFSQLIIDEAAAVRKRIELQELLVFETTLITHQPVPSFSQAVENAKRQLTDEDFHMVIDIRRARMQRIRPLGLTGGQGIATPAEQTTQPVVSEALEEAPILPAFDVEITPEINTPADKIALWQRKLLDLTTRNRLLHVPEKSKGVPLVCSEPGFLEDQLADGKKIKIVAVPDLEAGGRDAALHAQRHREDLVEQYAKDALHRNEVLSTLPKPKLEAELIDLYRKSRSDLDEGGANTLFLALGFLRWKKSADDPRSYRAPLILLPVKLERKSALSGVTMVMHEDEPRFNLTLLELLRQDFELTIPGLGDSLPMDESGVDVTRVWNIVRHAVRDVPGFEVSNELVLGTFSFAKYLMWKDLADRKDQLLKNAVVKHLIERSGEHFSSRGDFPRAEELDRKFDPSQLFTPLPGDSSQLAAVAASAEGFDFVLDGPPGTGKSQTIANMIAHNLALGRRVLFVAEKMAALDVVYRRLEEKGLGEFCLEVHSNKTSKIEVLKQLERAWDTRDQLSEQDWIKEAAEVRRLRDRLNDIVALLHQRRTNGLTLQSAIGRVVRDAGTATPRFTWPENTEHSEDDLAEMRNIVRRLGLNLKAIHETPAGFALIQHTDWSNAWQESLVSAAVGLPPKIDALVLEARQLLDQSKLPIPAESREEITRLVSLVRVILETHGVNLAFAFSPDVGEKITAAKRAVKILTDYRAVENKLSVRYRADAIPQLPLSDLESQWVEATKKFWFFASLARKKVIAALAEQGGTSGTPELLLDIPLLRRMQELVAELNLLSPWVADLPGWAALSSDVTQISSSVLAAEKLRTGIPPFATSPEHLIELRAAVRKWVVDANELLDPHGLLNLSLSRTGKALSAFDGSYRLFRERSGAAPDHQPGLASIRDTALEIHHHEARLQSWCAWRRVRDEAVFAGLLPLVEMLESAAVRPDEVAGHFETAYARWFAARIIDAEPRLRNFVSAEHMSDIETYRALDDRLSKLCVRYIRAKLCGLIPSKNDVSKRDGFGILKHELQKQRRHKPLRQLAIEMGDAMTRLAPCMLMSPLSIAQYLPTDLAPFDLVIFDEASQIAPWDAVGSIARGKQVVIAGDPRQMPPTSFFNRAVATTDDDTEEDMESILDECLGAGIPKHSLSWHYRSRHESLIAFSNHRYYDSNLITFPAAVTRNSAVTWKRVNGVYAKGRGRTNQAEAEAMVAEAVRRLTDPAFTGAGRSLAIVTLNSDQQKLVEDLLDQARQRHPEIEPYFLEDMTEPVVVKNLETVQGDERDLIMLGVGFGPTEPGSNSMSMSFGPLNRDGGWRRLNVAITRARHEMMIFTSFDSSMIDLNRTNSRAVRDLKHFLEFADRGPQALAEAVRGSVGGYDSPFEEAVARRLIDRGWQVVPQIGVSRFRIDLGIVHPDRPGDYLVGIECDGASYHSAATARDRDKVRAAVLGGLGWKLLRVWSTDWWVNPEGALDRLHSGIQALVDESRVLANSEQETQIFPTPLDSDAGETSVQATSQNEEASAAELLSMKFSDLPNTAVAADYILTDFSPFIDVICPDSFYQDSYDPILLDLITHVISSESPISETNLVQRVARGHRFQKSGRLIRERIIGCAEMHFHVRPDPLGGRFVWKDESSPQQWDQYRLATSEENLRKIEDIPFEELRIASLTVSTGDLPLEISRLLGIRRLSAAHRERLEQMVALRQ